MASLSTCHLELVVWDGNRVKSRVKSHLSRHTLASFLVEHVSSVTVDFLDDFNRRKDIWQFFLPQGTCA